MAYKFDMVLKGGTVVDYATDRDDNLDVASGTDRSRKSPPRSMRPAPGKRWMCPGGM